MSFGLFSTLAFASVALLSSTANAHILITQPVPFGNTTLTTSPLNNAAPGASGSNYPCQLRTGGYDYSVRTKVTAGQSSPLEFSGSASHGGGVCELLVTTDAEPDANTQFKLFEVIQGCPIKDDSSSGGVSSYDYTLPTDMPSGNLTFAWVWYNRIGNREIYMNCAPIEVTGGSDSLDGYNALNNAYLINLPREECSSTEMGDTIIPNPGKAVIQNAGHTSLVSASGPSCAASAAAMTKGASGGSGAGSGSGSSPATSAASATAPASSAMGGYSSAASAAPSAAPTSAPSVGSSAAAVTMSTVVASSPADSSAYPTMTPSSDAGMSAPGGGSAPTGYSSPTGSSSSSGSTSGGSTGGDGITCSSDGAQYGQAVNGAEVWRPVASGTQCQNGQIVKRSLWRHAHMRRAGHV